MEGCLGCPTSKITHAFWPTLTVDREISRSSATQAGNQRDQPQHTTTQPHKARLKSEPRIRQVVGSSPTHPTGYYRQMVSPSTAALASTCWSLALAMP